MLAMPFQIVTFNVFPSSLVEVLLEIHEFFHHRRSKSPHRVTKSNRRALAGRSGSWLVMR